MRAFTILALSLFIVSCVAEDVEAPDVFELTESNFDATLADKKKLFVLFFAPWCGHCKKLAPTYNKLALELKEGAISIAKVDCTSNQKLCGKYSVRGYPTVKYITTEKTTDYEGDRSMDSLRNFLKKIDAPAYTKVTTVDELNKIVTDNKNSVVGLFKTEDNAKVFFDVADQFKFDIFNFVALIADDFKAVTEKYTLGESFIFYLGDETKVYADEYTKASFGAFLKRAKIPLFGHLTQNSFRAYSDTELPMGTLAIAKDDKNFETISALFTKIATKHKKIAFCYILSTDKMHSYFNLPNEHPAFAINIRAEDIFYAYKGKLEEAEIEEFITQFEDGKLQPSVKSEPIPKNDDPKEIFDVVGNTLEEVVGDATRDVLVKFYATWCGHCKKLEPIYKKLAEHFAEDSKVRIARINVPENTIPRKYGVQGFPTIIMFRANNKKPEKYTGDRSYEDMVSFVMKGREGEKKDEKKEEKKDDGKKEL